MYLEWEIRAHFKSTSYSQMSNKTKETQHCQQEASRTRLPHDLLVMRLVRHCVFKVVVLVPLGPGRVPVVAVRLV